MDLRHASFISRPPPLSQITHSAPQLSLELNPCCGPRPHPAPLFLPHTPRTHWPAAPPTAAFPSSGRQSAAGRAPGPSRALDRSITPACSSALPQRRGFGAERPSPRGPPGHVGAYGGMWGPGLVGSSCFCAFQAPDGPQSWGAAEPPYPGAEGREGAGSEEAAEQGGSEEDERGWEREQEAREGAGTGQASLGPQVGGVGGLQVAARASNAHAPGSRDEVPELAAQRLTLLGDLLSRLLPETDPSQHPQEAGPGAQGALEAHPPQASGAAHVSSGGEERGGAAPRGRKGWRADEFVAKGVSRIRAHVLFEDTELHRSLQFVEALQAASPQGLAVLNSPASALEALASSFPNLVLGTAYPGWGAIPGGGGGASQDEGTPQGGQAAESLGAPGISDQDGEHAPMGGSDAHSDGVSVRGGRDVGASGGEGEAGASRGEGDAGALGGEGAPSELLRHAAGLSPVLHVLVHQWGLRREADVARILLAHPGLVGLPLSVADAWRRELKQVGLRVRDMGPMVARCPWVLSRSALRNIPVVVAAFAEAKIPPSEVEVVLARCPQLLLASPDRCILPAAALLPTLGLSRRLVRRALAQAPAILCCTAEELQQQLEWLRSIGVPERELGHVVCRAPAFLCTSTASLDSKLAFLAGIGVEGGEAVRVVCRYPEVLLTSVKSMQNRVYFLQGSGFCDEDIGKMIVRFPPVLGYGIDAVLKPKLEFWAQTMGRTKKELAAFPKFFSLSLQNRVKPRLRVIARRGVTQYDVAFALTCSEDVFAERFMGIAPALIPYTAIAQTDV